MLCRLKLCVLFSCLLILVSVNEVELTVMESSGVGRSDWPVTSGIPLVAVDCSQTRLVHWAGDAAAWSPTYGGIRQSDPLRQAAIHRAA